MALHLSLRSSGSNNRGSSVSLCKRAEWWPCLGLARPASWEGYQECQELWGGEQRLSHLHFLCEALLVCGDPSMFSSPRWPIPVILHPPLEKRLCSPSLSFNHIIHLPVEFRESNEIIMLRLFCKYLMGRAIKGYWLCRQEKLSSNPTLCFSVWEPHTLSKPQRFHL